MLAKGTHTYVRIFFRLLGLFMFFNLSIILWTVFWSFLHEYETGYVLFASLSELKEWFPHFFWLIYAGAALFRYGTPILFIILLFFLERFARKPAGGIIGVDYVRLLMVEFLVALTTLLVFVALYFISREFPFTATFETQRILTRLFCISILLQIARRVVVDRTAVMAGLRTFLLLPDLPYSLSIFRILFFSYNSIFLFFVMPRYVKSVMVGSFKPLAIFGPFFEMIQVGGTSFQYLMYAAMAVSLLVAIGFQTRIFLVLTSILNFYVISLPNFFGTSWHHHLFIWIPWFFVFSKCYDVYSVDAWLKPRPIVRSADYRFPLRLIWMQIGILYFCAGFQKLWDSGFDWALTDSMINQMQLEWFENFDRVPDFRLDKWPMLIKATGLAVVCFEMAYFFLLFRSKLRLIAIVGALAMHNAFGYFLHIGFIGTLQVFYVGFIDWTALFYRKVEEKASTVPLSAIGKVGLWSGVILLLINLGFGMASIQTYPFSGYPEYSDIIPSEIQYIAFSATTANGDSLDLRSEAQQSGFHWETFRRREQGIAAKWNSGQLPVADLEAYWRLWTLNVPVALNTETLDVYLLVIPMSPELRDSIISRTFLLRWEHDDLQRIAHGQKLQ